MPDFFEPKIFILDRILEPLKQRIRRNYVAIDGIKKTIKEISKDKIGKPMSTPGESSDSQGAG